MSNPTITAVRLSDGARVEVYRLQSGGYCLYSDCNTKYTKDELKLPNK